MNITEKLAAALRGLPDECGMVEHNPDEGPRLFCCGGDIVETLRSNTRKHALDCWYVQAREVLAEYDAQRAKATVSATDLIRSMLTAIVDLHNGYPIRELHIDADTLRQQAAALGVTLEDGD